MKIYKLLSLVCLVCFLVLSTACGEKKQGEAVIPQATDFRTQESKESSSEAGTVGESEENSKEAFHGNVQESNEGSSQTPQEESVDEVEKILSGMTLKEKICQMFIVTPEQATGKKGVTTVAGDFAERLKEFPVGGIIFFPQNLQNRTQVTAMLSDFQRYAREENGMPLFLCVDEEGGRVARIANNEAFGIENVGPMAEKTTKEEAYEAGKTIGGYLKELGFNVDFAPDADVITNPENQIIGERSFGTEPDVVADLASAYSKGLQEQNVLSTFKHFPGHGATEGDTHEGFAFTSKSLEELKQAELVPFYRASECNVDFMMVAHISLPGVLGDNTPCTLSKTIITDILKDDMGYQGLVITDAMNMGAITKNYKAKEACVKAVQAGNDIILMPVNLETACEAIMEAVEQGEIDEWRIDESVRKIVKLKIEKLR